VTEGNIYWSLRGREYRLGAAVAEAGDGVFCVPLSREIVAKIYDDGSDPAVRERKIAAMLKRPPDLPDIVEDGERFVRMAWPVASLHDRSRKFVGFLMPALDMQATSPLECVLEEDQARTEGLPTSLGAKINLAARLAVAITELHQQEHHVVHLTPANLRFHRQSLHLALIGCERFSIRAERERFAADPCPEQIALHYLAPEFQNQPIPPGQEESQDLFAFAVLVFQLLNFGIHPYTGSPTRNGFPDDIPARIARNGYAYGAIPHPDLKPSPDSGHQAMPSELRSLFDRAFAGPAGGRPAAQEWATWLQFFAIPSNNCVVVCEVNAGHHHFADLPCAACAREPLPPATQDETEIRPKIDRADFLTAIAPPFAQPEHAFPPARQFPPATKPEQPAPIWAALRKLSSFEKVALLATLIVAVWFGVSFLVAPKADSQSAADSVPKPAVAPAAPATDPYLAGNAALEQSEAETDGYVKAAALAITTLDRPEWQRAITNLHTDAPAHPPAPPSAFQATFTDFSAGLSKNHFDERTRLGLLKNLRDALKQNPLDDESAYELGWLSLVGGQRDEAKNFFLHAIWVNPDRANAWYGLGVIAADDNQKTGALATAEMLATDPTQAESMHNAFPPLLLRLCMVNTDHFAVLLAIAQRLADHYRPMVTPPATNETVRGDGMNVASPH
jgi:tetratricopeptide (TPR) repeat protein